MVTVFPDIDRHLYRVCSVGDLVIVERSIR
jgi:hypothetical protein